MLSPYYQRAHGGDIQATPGKTEPPFWLRALRQTHMKALTLQPSNLPTPPHSRPSGWAWHAGKGGPTLFAATGAERASRQMDDLDRSACCLVHPGVITHY